MDPNATNRDRKRAGWALVIGMAVALAGLLIIGWGADFAGMIVFCLGACTFGVALGRLWRLSPSPR